MAFRVSCGAVCAFVVLVQSAAGVTYRTVARTGDPAPGTSLGVFFDRFGQPAIDENGRVAFTATLTGFGVDPTNDSGLWIETAAGLVLAGRAGMAAPGMPAGVVFADDGFGYPSKSKSGGDSFPARLDGPGVTPENDLALWRRTGSSWTRVIRTGMPAPGTEAGVNFRGFEYLYAFNDTSRLAFWGSLIGPGVDLDHATGIWSDAGGTLEMLVRGGNQAAGLPPDVVHRFFHLPVMNRHGQVAFHGSLLGPGVNEDNELAVWSSGSGTLRLIAREGGHPPGTPIGVQYAYFRDEDGPDINDRGHIAFKAVTRDPGGSNAYGIWTDTLGLIRPVALSGDPAPGTPAGVAFSFLSTPVINGNDWVVFLASLVGSGVDHLNDMGIWAETQTGLRMIVRAGSRAPGTPPDVNFDFLWNPLVNCSNQVVFYSLLYGPGVDLSNDQCIYAYGTGGSLDPLVKVIRIGDLFPVGPNDFRRPSSLLLHLENGSGNQDGRHRSFNDAGQVAFWSAFQDGSSGIFVADVFDNPICCTRGDLNGDEEVTAADAPALVEFLTDAGIVSPQEQCAADANEDGFNDGRDISAFVELVIGP